MLRTIFPIFFGILSEGVFSQSLSLTTSREPIEDIARSTGVLVSVNHGSSSHSDGGVPYVMNRFETASEIETFKNGLMVTINHSEMHHVREIEEKTKEFERYQHRREVIYQSSFGLKDEFQIGQDAVRVSAQYFRAGRRGEFRSRFHSTEKKAETRANGAYYLEYGKFGLMYMSKQNEYGTSIKPWNRKKLDSSTLYEPQEVVGFLKNKPTGLGIHIVDTKFFQPSSKDQPTRDKLEYGISYERTFSEPLETKLYAKVLTGSQQNNRAARKLKSTYAGELAVEGKISESVELGFHVLHSFTKYTDESASDSAKGNGYGAFTRIVF